MTAACTRLDHTVNQISERWACGFLAASRRNIPSVAYRPTIMRKYSDACGVRCATATRPDHRDGVEQEEQAADNGEGGLEQTLGGRNGGSHRRRVRALCVPHGGLDAPSLSRDSARWEVISRRDMGCPWDVSPRWDMRSRVGSGLWVGSALSASRGGEGRAGHVVTTSWTRRILAMIPSANIEAYPASTRSSGSRLVA